MGNPLTFKEAFERLGYEPFDYQRGAAEVWQAQKRQHPRLCLYYRTGAGKSITALVLLALKGVEQAVVVAPPSTQTAWVEVGETLGIAVQAVSHAKFRMSDFKLSRTMPLVIDEVHLLGGHTGKGWKKADRLSKGLLAPVILCSATPNYNDAERVYCIQHILDYPSVQGGFLQFLYTQCDTQENPFGMIPIVTGFKNGLSSRDYLAALDDVVYLPDDVYVQIRDQEIYAPLSVPFKDYNVDTQTERVMASAMEKRHRTRRRGLALTESVLQASVRESIEQESLMADSKGLLIFCNSAKNAQTVFDHLSARPEVCNNKTVGIVTGKTSFKVKEALLNSFRSGVLQVLIGTSTLATGTDGLDKVCDRLLIVDDTDDDALRRQLIGRILPRGGDTDASMKAVTRFVYINSY